MDIKEDRFKKIIADHQDMVYRLCCSYVTDADIRKDLYQNILINIWRGLSGFEGRSVVSTWIYRIAVNTGLDFLRAESKNRKLLTSGNRIDIEPIDRMKSSEENLLEAERIEILYHCIRKLNFVEKTIITLYLEELSYQEIAEIVGISAKNVSVKIHRTKKILNTCLRNF